MMCFKTAMIITCHFYILLSKEMAMQEEVDEEQLKEIENISLFAKEPTLTQLCFIVFSS